MVNNNHPLPESKNLILKKEGLPSESPFVYEQKTPYLLEEKIDFRDYLAVILRRKWTILSIFLVVVITVGIYTFKTPPLYKATATVEISAAPQVTPFGARPTVRLIEQSRYLKTQADILKSRTLATRVIEVLELENNPEFNGKHKGFGVGRILGFVRSIFQKKKPASNLMNSEEAKRERIIQAFLKRLEIKSHLKGGPGSYMLEVSFKSHDPRLCADVVNTLISEYINFDLEKRVQATKLGQHYLNMQIEKVQAKLEKAEERLNKFAKEHDIVFLSQLTSRGEGGEDISTAQLVSLADELNKAESQRISLESLYNQSKIDPEDLPQVQGDTLIQSMKGELSTLREKYANLSTVFTPQYPEMKRLRSQIKMIESQIQKEKRLIVATIKARYQTAVKKEKMIREALNTQKKRVSTLKQMAIDYKILQREVETNQHIYELLLKKSKEMEVEVGIKSSGIHPIDKATVPLKAFKPRKMANMLFALVIGLVGGLFGAFAIEYFDNTFKSPEEVEKTLRIPILGTIPSVSLKKEEVKKQRTVEMEALKEPRSAVAEAFRMIHTSLMLSTPGGPPKVLLVTSPQVGGGKSFISFNLAVVYAQMGARVLLIDCDLRKPRLHKILKTSSNPGLSNFLVGKMDLKTITKSIGKSLDHGLELDFIPSGAIPPNPVELLNSKIFSDYLTRLRETYDMVIIDSPALVGFADPLVLGRLADGTLVVIRNEQTARPAAKHGCDMLFQVGANLLGAVINDFKIRKGSYYYGKYYAYHYYYGRYYTKDRKPELTG